MKQCPKCNNQHTKRGLYCTLKCNPNVGGYRNGSGRAKHGYYKGIYCGSTYELIWVIYQLDHNIDFQRFPMMLEYSGKKYIPDFLQNGKIIEIKGYEKRESVLEKTNVANKNGYYVVVLRKEDLTKEFTWVKENYSYKNVFELYDDYKPKYKYTCSHCVSEFVSEINKVTSDIFCSRQCAGKFRQKTIKSTDDWKRKIGESLLGKSPTKYTRKHKQIWITDGVLNTRIKETDAIPIGFKRGRS